MKKNFIIKTVVAVIIAVMLAGIVGTGVMAYSGDKFIKQSEKYEYFKDVRSLTEFVSSKKVIFHEGDKIFTKKYSELGVKVIMSKGGSEHIEKKLFIDLREYDIEYDVTKLASHLKNLNENRSLEKGNYIDIYKLESYIMDNMLAEEVEVRLEDFYQVTE